MKLLLSLLMLVIVSCGKADDPKLLFDKGEFSEAYKLWKPMAEQGDITAQNYIGIHHYLGLGVKRDHKSAKEWFEKAAMNGFADAQYNLGVMYDNGEYVKQNFITAYKWFYLAKQNGNTHSGRRMKAMADDHKILPNQMKEAVKQAEVFIRNNK